MLHSSTHDPASLKEDKDNYIRILTRSQAAMTNAFQNAHNVSLSRNDDTQLEYMSIPSDRSRLTACDASYGYKSNEMSNKRLLRRLSSSSEIVVGLCLRSMFGHSLHRAGRTCSLDLSKTRRSSVESESSAQDQSSNGNVTTSRNYLSPMNFPEPISHLYLFRSIDSGIIPGTAER